MQALLPAFGGVFGDEGERAYLSHELQLSLRAHWLRSGIMSPEVEV
jgi:hypothetical protein